MLNSCIYEGTVTHARRNPVDHRLRYPLRWFYLDLDEIPDLVASLRLLSTGRWHPYSFLAADHGFLDDGSADALESLKASIRTRLTIDGKTPAGPIHLLTPLRQFGFYFSPLCLYFCWNIKSPSGTDRKLHSVIAEVNNTPWRERHWYVLNEDNLCEGSSALHYQHAKEFHVSPFMDMDSTYDWCLTLPGDQLTVKMNVLRAGSSFFAADMRLKRKPLTDRALAYSLLRFPIASVQMLAAIHFEALRLWKKKCPFFDHPSKRPQDKHPATA